MYCSSCGSKLNDNARFCHVCGQAVQGAPEMRSEAVVIDGPRGNPTPVLVWGILGLAFAVAGPLSFLGIIFSCIGRGKAKEYIDQYGTSSKQATVGRNLSKAGLIAGIVVTVLVVLYVIFLIGFFGLLIKYGHPIAE